MNLVNLIGLSLLLSAIGIGGSLYEYWVIDSVWPNKLALIQPKQGGIQRVKFWIPAHVAFELTLIACLILSWSFEAVRNDLLIAFGLQMIMRVWSFLDFIPKAAAFETISQEDYRIETAKAWTRRSLLRLPFCLGACIAIWMALLQLVSVK